MQSVSGARGSHGLRASVLGVLFLVAAHGQTRIDLSRQSRQADFRLQNLTAPFVTGTSVPPVCSTGEVYFRTDATPGENLYVCVTTNTWAVVARQADETEVNLHKQLLVVRASDNRLVVGGCSAQQPCNYGFNEQVNQITEAIQITVTGGGGTLLGYLDRSAGYVVATSGNLTVTCTGCTVLPGVTVFPWDSIPQFRWAAASGLLEAAGFDLRSMAQRDILIPGENISMVRSADGVVISATATASSAQGVTSSDTVTVPGGIAVFAGTDGKQIRGATGSGFVKSASGALQTVSELKAADLADSSKQGTGSLLATAGSVTPGRCAEWDANGTLISSSGPCGQGTSSSSVGIDDIEPGAKQGSGSLLTTAGAVTPGRCAQWDANGTLVSSDVPCGTLSAGTTIGVSNIAPSAKQGNGSLLPTSGSVTPGRCAEWDENGTLVSSNVPCGASTGANMVVSTLDRLRSMSPVFPVYGTLNQIRVLLVSIPHTFTPTKAAVSITASGAGARCYLGVYGQDGAKRAQSDFVDAGSNGVKLVSFSAAPVLNSGAYYVAWSCDNAAVRMSGVVGDATVAALLNANSSTFVSLGISSLLTSGGVMPATLGTITASTIDTPQIILFNR